jgi:hypothetical protein
MTYEYTFEFDGGSSKNFQIELDPENLSLINLEKFPKPDWTKMESFMCPHCPLNAEVYPHCPLAVSLTNIIDLFKELPSYEQAKITVRTPQRDYSKHTQVQVGLGSIMGVLMVSSGCPIMAKLKPMARFHLPFASLEETESRAYATYLLAQYIKMKQGKEADWNMKELRSLYDNILKLNKNVASKIGELEKYDANINAVIVLNNFADTIKFDLDEYGLIELEKYLQELL